jgi:hypothetical protein
MSKLLTLSQKAYLDNFQALLDDRERREADPRWHDCAASLTVGITKLTIRQSQLRTDKVMIDTTTHRQCAHHSCNQVFEVSQSDRSNRKYCSVECASTMKRIHNHMAYKKYKTGVELSVEEAIESMLNPQKRKTVLVEEVDFKYETRHCDFNTDDVSCITKLCRYNPGPYCFHHAELIASEVQAHHDRKRIRELKEMERIWAS